MYASNFKSVLIDIEEKIEASFPNSNILGHLGLEDNALQQQNRIISQDFLFFK